MTCGIYLAINLNDYSYCKWNTGYLGIPRYFITIPYHFVFSDTAQPYIYINVVAVKNKLHILLTVEENLWMNYVYRYC